MAFSPAKALQGITRYSKVSEHMIIWAPGDPGVTYTKGTVVVRGAASGNYGCVIKASDSSPYGIGRVHKTVVCPAATQAFPVPGSPPLDLDGAAMKTLIPIEVERAVGKRLLKGHAYLNAQDEAVVSYSATRHSAGVTTGFGTDHYGAGALVYVYEGPGKGECNVVEDYDHTGEGAELAIIFHRVFNATLTSASKLLVFTAKGAAGDGIGPVGAWCDLDESSATLSDFDAADGYDDGNYETLMDWWLLGGLMADGAFLAMAREGSS